MQKMVVVIGVVIALAALGLTGAMMMKKNGGRQAEQPAQAEGGAQRATPVTVMTVEARDLVERVSITGSLQPADEVTVGTRFAGRVSWVAGKTGTRVRAGHVVARLEDQDIRAQLRSADAARQAAAARVAQAQAALAQQQTATTAGIASAEAAQDAAQARLEQAKAAAAQQQTATGSGIKTAKANVDAAQARYQQAQATASATEATVTAQLKAADATLAAANSRLTMLRKGARAQEKVIAENAVALARATYENDKANYDRLKQLYDEQALARSVLDNAETKMKVSKAQLESAQQQLALVNEGPRAEEIQAAEAAVRQAEEGVATARANLRQIDVAKANVEIARTGLEQANAALESAESARQVDIMRDKDVLAAQAGLKQAKEAVTAARAAEEVNRMRKSDLLAARAAEQQAIQAHALALQSLDDTLIYTPVDGVVAARLVDVGQSVGSNAAVLKIATDRSLFLEASISELEATRIRAGQPVELTVDALQGNRTNFFGAREVQPLTGMVEKVVPVVDTRTRNFTVRVVVPATPELFPGMFARGGIIVARHVHVVAVPKEALVMKGEQQVLFLADSGKARAQTVTAGVSDGAYVQILSGLAIGDQVVVTGQQSLADKDPINIKTTKPAGAVPAQ